MASKRKAPVVALVGVSGVGKTSFLRRIGVRLRFQHLTAGSLIAMARAKHLSAPRNRDGLRFLNIDENQQLLVTGFDIARDLAAPLVLLDGHVVIHGASGLQPVSSGVFARLRIDAMAHLEATPQQIILNRRGDQSRQRPPITEKEVAEQQIQSRSIAMDICKTISLPFVVTSATEEDTFVSFLASLGMPAE